MLSQRVEEWMKEVVSFVSPLNKKTKALSKKSFFILFFFYFLFECAPQLWPQFNYDSDYLKVDISLVIPCTSCVVRECACVCG